VRIGTPADEIVKFADDKKADLLVVGTHGRSGIRRMLVGSVADSVVRRAPCPVLAVRVGAEEEARAATRDPRHDARAISRIVCAVDTTPSSRAALRAACDLAGRFDATVVAVNVIDDYILAQAGMLSQLDAVSIEGRFGEIARANLERCIAETVGDHCGRGIERRVEVGRPSEAIARVATQEGAQLVTCGTHGRTGLARALFGSIAEQIVRAAPCPVLTVREGPPAARAAAGFAGGALRGPPAVPPRPGPTG
jgi:nucleotide-binding universal stress UspA family protein